MENRSELKIQSVYTLGIIIALCVLLRFLGFYMWSILLFPGFIGIAIVYSNSLLERMLYVKSDRKIILLEFLTVLMSIALLLRYFAFDFAYWPTSIFIPLYAFFAVVYLVKKFIGPLELKLLTILFLLLIIPMVVPGIDYGPSKFKNLKKTPYSDVESVIAKDFPYELMFDETKELCQLAYKLEDQKRFQEAVLIYQEAKKIEPRNPKVFYELSESYARINNLEMAISMMDTAIMIDSNYSGSFNNRGLLFYKQANFIEAIDNYNEALRLDSTNMVAQVNLALAFNGLKDYTNACIALEKGIELGYELKGEEILMKLRKKHCIN